MLRTLLAAHRKNLRYVLEHKRAVYHAARAMGLGWWQSIIHDWSKFGPREWFAYTRYFSGPQPPSARAQAAFRRAWLGHIHRNPHHWQHWLLKQDDGAFLELDMPERYIREMIADWRGASLAQGHGSDVVPWYKRNAGNMLLSARTRLRVEELLGLDPTWRMAEQLEREQAAWRARRVVRPAGVALQPDWNR